MPEIYYYLADALREHSPGAVATEIERNGCLGYDRYGRICLIRDTSDKNEVLEHLAEFHRLVNEWDESEDSLDPEGGTRIPSSVESLIDSPSGYPFWSFGWDKDSICVFHTKLDSHSTANWTLIPRETGQ
jgi:hypothetical protein